MITSFKIFENSELIQRYWKVPIDDYFFVRLDKIGMDEKAQHEIYDHYLDCGTDSKIVWLGEDDFGDGHSHWYWDFSSDYNDSDGSFYANSDLDKYEYQGEVDITPEDIEKWKFKNDTKKYNL